MNMNVKYIIIYFIFLNNKFNFSLCDTNSNWIEPIAEKVLSEINGKQISIFTFDKLSNDNYDDLILSAISKRVSTISINLKKYLPINNISMPEFENPRNNLWIAIILRNDFTKSHWNKIKDVMEFIKNASISAPRPKLMAISVDGDAWNVGDFKNILLNAWKMKYLDFTILGNDKNGNLKIMHYNPFNDTYFIGNFNLTTEIFPDKSNNMYGYEIKFPMYKSFINSTFFHENYNASKFIFIKICDILNCTLKSEKVDKSFDRYEDILQEIFSSLEKNEFNFFPIDFYRQRYSKSKIWGVNSQYLKVIFVVRNRQVSEFNISNLFLSLLYFFSYFILFILLSKIFRFPKNSWNFLNIYEILIGQKINLSVNTTLQRIIFLFIIFSALGITAEFSALSKMTVLEDRSFDSFESISTSDVPIYSPSEWYTEFYLKRINKSIINTINMPYNVSNTETCINKIVLENQNVVCITDEILGEYYTNKYIHKSSGRKILKIIKDELYGEYTAFPFEYRSPFFEKFNDLKERIIESGLKKHWEYLKFKPEFTKQDLKLYKMHDFHGTVKRISIVLIFGYLMAILTFFSEMLINKCIEKITFKITNLTAPM